MIRAYFSRPLRGLLLASFSIVIGLSASHGARAQAGAVKPPETYNPIDANGVNLLSGSMTASTPTISIGPDGGGLSYSQSYDSGSITPWSESTNGMVATSTLTNDPWYTVTMMGQAFPFKRTGDTFAAVEGSTATLVMGGGTFTLTLLDGTVATYSTAYPTYALGVVNNLGSIVKIVSPNGRTIDFTYAVIPDISTAYGGVRLQSVNSSDGYQLHYDYAADLATGPWRNVVKVTALNNAIDACASTAPACSYSRVWPSLTFGGGGNVRTVTDAVGRATSYIFTDGTLTGVRRPGRASGQDVQVYYNGESQMVERVTRDWGVYTYAIPQGYRDKWPDGPDANFKDTGTSVTDPLGHTRIITSHSVQVDKPTRHWVSRLKTVVDANNKATWYGYSNYRLSSITQPEGNGVGYAFDARGNIQSIIRFGKPPPGGGTGTLQVIAAATYPASCTAATLKTCNRPLTVSDARGGVTTYAYDPNSIHGDALTVTSPSPTAGAAQPQIRTTYAPFNAWYKNAAGVLTQDPRSIYLPTITSSCATLGPAVDPAPAPCVGTADEVKSTITYQAGGASAASNLLAVSTTSGGGDGVLSATTVMSYTAAGDLSAVDGPLSGAQDTTRTYYNDARQVTDVIGPDPDGAGNLLYRASHTTYAPDGQVSWVETGTATNQSDTGPSTFAALQKIVATYDVGGRKASDSLVVGGVAQTLTQYDYDAASRLMCQAVRMAPTAVQATSACSPLLRDDGYDRVTYNDYDKVDRVTQITTGYGASSPRIEKHVTYSDNGKEQTVADGNGNTTTYEYDAFDRLAKVRYPGPTCCASSTTDYEEYGYDTADNRTSWRRRDGTTVAFNYDALNRARNGLRGEIYGYDNVSRRTSAAYGGDAAAATFDALGRMTSESIDNQTYTYQYDLAGRRKRLTWTDGFFVTYAYDDAGEMISIAEGGSLVLATYAYDDLGRRILVSRANGVATTYGYDAASRLSALSHDLPGTAQDQTWTFTYNAAGQVKTRGSANSLYEWGAAQATKTYEVNGLNQLTLAAGTTIGNDTLGNLSNDGTKTYGYDLSNNLIHASAIGASTGVDLVYEPTGRLWRSSTNNIDWTYYVYSGADLVAEHAASGMTRRYVPGPGTDEPVVWYEGSGTTDRRWLLADPQGSIVSMTNAVGASIATNTYDEYGIPAATNLGRFQYTGQAWLPEVGLYHYKARAYSPTLGRFLQTDPIGYVDGLNWYSYVHNDPLNHWDPTGTTGCAWTTCEAPPITVTAGSGDGWRPIGRNEYDSMFGGRGGVQLTGNTPSAFPGPLDVPEIVSNAWDMRSIGLAGEASVRASIIAKGYTIIGEQVYVRTADGKLRVVDFMISDNAGGIAAIEAKANTATRSGEQLRRDASIFANGGTIVSRGPLGGGLRYGAQVRFDTTEVGVRVTKP